MDPSLLKQREAFKRHALSTPVIEKFNKRPSDADSASSKSKASKKPKHEPPRPAKDFDYKAVAGSSQLKFAILAKVVKFLRSRHQEGDSEPLTIDEILDETNQLDIGARQKHWIITEALNNNPKVEVVDGDKYRFRPVLNVHDRRSLLKLLEQHDFEGLDGILYDEVEESVPNAAKVLRVMGDGVIRVTRPIDKKEVLFYNDRSNKVEISEEIQKQWRAATVEGVDERKIEEYLQRHNIVTMQDRAIKKASAQKRKVPKRKQRVFKSHNEHLGDILQDYSEKSAQ